jgi:uroporphyrinogen decarboxylase
MFEKFSHRERVFRALDHQTPDRTPLDGWFRDDTIEKLKSYFNVNEEEKIMKSLGIDIRTINIGASKKFLKEAEYIYPLGWYKRLPNGHLQDELGIIYEIVSTGTHWRFLHHPLEDAESVDEYDFPDVDLEERWVQAEKMARAMKNKYVIAGAIHCTFFETAWYLRGFQRFILDMHSNPSFVNKLLDKLLNLRIRMAKRFCELDVDIIELGDDLGMQKDMLISPELWRKYFKPRMQILINEIKNELTFTYFIIVMEILRKSFQNSSKSVWKF